MGTGILRKASAGIALELEYRAVASTSGTRSQETVDDFKSTGDAMAENASGSEFALLLGLI